MQNKWVNLFAGIIIQTILGGIYAWSIFVPHLTNNYGISKGQSGTIFGVCIAVFTLAMIWAGRIFDRKGPRFTASIGGVLFLLGYLIASFSGGSFLVIMIGIGVFSGAGIGFGYVCPLSVGMKWFPERKGLITGVAVAGFGGGAILLSTLGSHFMGSGMDVLIFFRWISIIAGALLLIASSVLAVPSSVDEDDTEKIGADKSTLLSSPFLLNVLGIFVGTFAGLLVVGNLSPMTINVGFSEEMAAQAVSVFAIGNAIGRVSWGHFFDKIDFKTIPLSLGGFAIFLLLLHLLSSFGIPYLILTGFLGFSFGGNFVIYASSISRYFGTDSFPHLYPICFLGYGLAGIIGPGTGGFIADTTGSYTIALYISIIMLATAAVITGFGLKVFDEKTE